jgi:flagellar basal-body rod modification protein FlgD
MTVSAANSTSTLVQPKDATGSSSLDQGDFMTLFITQLQYQDPMKPMDNYEMASQLAQFSNMQATTKMSDDLEKLLDFQTSQNNMGLLTLLDNQVQVAGNMMAVKDGAVTPTEFDLTEATDTVTLQVYDMADHLVWQEDKGGLSAGAYELDWDGKNLAGNLVEDGAYYYKVKAYGATGQTVDVNYTTTGQVTGVSFADGAATLTVDGFIEVGPDEILKVQ